MRFSLKYFFVKNLFERWWWFVIEFVFVSGDSFVFHSAVCLVNYIQTSFLLFEFLFCFCLPDDKINVTGHMNWFTAKYFSSNKKKKKRIIFQISNTLCGNVYKTRSDTIQLGLVKWTGIVLVRRLIPMLFISKASI